MAILCFEHNFTSMDSEFTQLIPFDRNYQHVQFSGSFAGQGLIWDAHIYTLTYYFREIKNISAARLNSRAFLDVGDNNEHGRKIEIGLHLPYLDLPSLRKTMIMVRQYKRLKPGRYEFGETIII